MAKITDKQIQFGYGSLGKVLGQIGTADGLVAFGTQDINGKTGAIVANGEIVSSKVLDVSVNREFVSNRDLKAGTAYVAGTKTTLAASDLNDATKEYGWVWGVKTVIDVTYIDAATKETKVLTFDAVDDSTQTWDHLNSINTFLAKTDNIVEKAQKVGDTSVGALDVSVMPDADPTKPATYSIGVKVDDKTVRINSDDKLATNVHIVYLEGDEVAQNNAGVLEPASGTPATGHDKARIALVDGEGYELSFIDATKFAGGGVIYDTYYEDVDNTLTLYFKDSNGLVKYYKKGATGNPYDETQDVAGAIDPVKIDLKKLLDISDVFIANDSSVYLDVNFGADSSISTYSTKMRKIADASYNSTTFEPINTGLIDAADLKHYLDVSFGNLEQEIDFVKTDADTAKDRKYVSGGISVDNKGTIVGVDVDGSTFLKVVYGVYGEQAVADGKIKNSSDGIATVEDTVKAIDDTSIFLYLTEKTTDADKTDVAYKYVVAGINPANNKEIDVSISYGIFETQSAAGVWANNSSSGLATTEAVTAYVQQKLTWIDLDQTA